MIKAILICTFTGLSFSFSCWAQVDLPYASSFENASEMQGWVEYRLGIDTFSSWTQITQDSISFMDHDRPFGNNAEDTVRDWWISPLLDLGQTNQLSFSISGFTFIGLVPADHFGVYLSVGSPDPADMEYELIGDFTDSSLFNSWRHQELIFNSTGAGYLGFKYQCTDNWYTMSLDSVEVKSLPVGMAEYSEHKSFTVHRNGEGWLLNFTNLDFPVHAAVSDLQGRMLLDQQVSYRTDHVSLKNLSTAGVLLIRVTDSSGWGATQKLMPSLR